MSDTETPTYVTVPILVNFDNRKAIGELRILKDALPKTPEFVFTIGFQAHQLTEKPGTWPAAPYCGDYTLAAVSITTDDNYLAYLRQIGKA